MPNNRDFKGVWIPKEIWLLKDISFIEKGFLVEIDSLDNEKGCFASNKHFSDFFQLSEDRCSEIISGLKAKGYITVNIDKSSGKSIRTVKMIFNTTRRKGRVVQEDPLGEKAEWPLGENTAPNNTVSNNPIENSEIGISQKESAPNFEEFMYELGYEPFEMVSDNYVLQTYRSGEGRALASGRLKEFQKEYKEKYKKDGIENINPQPRKIVKPIDQVFHVFGDNPASVTWYSNKTQRNSAAELLKIMTVEQVRQMYLYSKEIENYKNAPQIDTPYELLNKIAKLKSFYSGGGSVGVV